MKLYDNAFSPNCLRVRAVAFELGVDLELVPTNIAGPKDATLVALNPNAKVPVLVDGDLVLWESRAIIRYLAATYPEPTRLLPASIRDRAIVDQWSFWQAIHLGPSMQKVAFERVFKPLFGLGTPDAAAIEAELAASHRFLSVLDGALHGRDFVAGALSVADFELASTFMHRAAAGISLDDVPAVAAWIERVEARDAWKRAVAPMLAGMAARG